MCRASCDSQSVRSPAKYEKKPVKNSAAPSANPLTAATAWFRVNADAKQPIDMYRQPTIRMPNAEVNIVPSPSTADSPT